MVLDARKIKAGGMVIFISSLLLVSMIAPAMPKNGLACQYITLKTYKSLKSHYKSKKNNEPQLKNCTSLCNKLEISSANNKYPYVKTALLGSLKKSCEKICNDTWQNKVRCYKLKN